MSITVRKNKKGRNVYDVAFMYKGTRYKKRGFSTKTAAREWETSVKSQVLENGSYYAPSQKMLLEVIFEAFEIEKTKKNFRQSTINTYINSFKNISKHKISKMCISQITYKDIQSYFNEISKDKGRGICLQIKRSFNMAFKYAYVNQYIKTNPMQYTTVAGIESGPKEKTISYDDFLIICNEFLTGDFKDYSIYVALNIGYFTGMRVSEVLVLEKSDVNFETHTININKRLESLYSDSIHVAPLKTKASYGDQPMPEQLENILKEWFKINHHNIIVCHENGSYIRYCVIQYDLKKASKKLDIPFTFHMLRHSYATNIVSSNTDIKMAQTLMRHTRIETTLGIYAHSDMSKEQETINKVFKDYPKNTPKTNNDININ